MPITNPIDGTTRRRVYLMRHAEAAYRQADGSPASDPRQVPLTPSGRAEAAYMRDLLADLALDFALCSGLPRTRETAAIVLERHALELVVDPAFEELRTGHAWNDPVADIAYPFDRATEPGARFLGGEDLGTFSRRVTTAFERQLRDATWRRGLFVCHGGTNRAVAAWALGAGLEVLGALEQDSCCVNVVDVDVDDEGGIVRRFVRALNLTPYDWVKREIHVTTMEHTALEASRNRI